MEKEIWKDIPGYEGGYQASSFGRVRSIDRLIDSGKGVMKSMKGKVLSQSENDVGYFQVSVRSTSESHCITKRVHRLVALAFISNKENNPLVNHINGDKKDNRVENLEWCTVSHNSKHAYEIGLRKSVTGTEHHSSKLTPEDVLNIRRDRNKLGLKLKDIAEKYQICAGSVYDIATLKTWKHIKTV